MGLQGNSVQVTTKISVTTNEDIQALALAYGIDAGEYRRHLLIDACDRARIKFREAHGMSLEEWIAKQDAIAKLLED